MELPTYVLTQFSRCRVEEFRQLKAEEQQIYGDSGAVWDRCIVHGLFSAQPNMQIIQEHLRVLTDGAALQFEAGKRRLLSMARLC